MKSKVDVEILRHRGKGLLIDGELHTVGDKVSVDPDLAQSFVRHSIAKRVKKTAPMTPGSPAKGRQTRTQDPDSNRLEE